MEERMNSDRALFTRILCQFLLGGGLGFLLAVALLAANAHQLFDLTSNSPSPYVLLCIFVCGLSMYIGFGAALTVPVRPCGSLDTWSRGRTRSCWTGLRSMHLSRLIAFSG